MCGIVGYIGKQNAVNVLYDGLSHLEYRGYDSAGIAFLNGSSNVHLEKYPGKLAVLEEQITTKKLEAHIGIGHTRWATHGIPNKPNAHPHMCCKKEIAVVHNGIVENHSLLRDILKKEGHTFRSDTDSEIIAHLVEKYYDGDLVQAVCSAIKDLEGSFAISVLSKNHPELLVGARRGSPLIVGIGENEMFLASDVPAILKHTKKVVYLNENEVVVIKHNSYDVITIEGEKIDKPITTIDWDFSMAEKGGYEHFMLKEIFEQPLAIKNTLSTRIQKNKHDVVFEDMGISNELFKSIDSILIISCGTAWHAGLVGKYMLEEFAGISVEVDVASEFRYRKKKLNPKTLVLTISQSGETADTLAGVSKAKNEDKCPILSICNVKGSTLARESDGVIYTHAGPEIAVASTKAYTSQLTVLALFTVFLGKLRGVLSNETAKEILSGLEEIPHKADSVLQQYSKLKNWAKKYSDVTQVLTIGRGYNFPTAFESALKLKETSYIHAEGYGAGEMKHGPIALINDQLPVICIATQSPVYEKMLSNIQEIRARKGIILALATVQDKEISKYTDHLFRIPKIIDMLSPILTIIPLQLFAYYVAVNRNCDVDKPRNLAKSVTVE